METTQFTKLVELENEGKSLPEIALGMIVANAKDYSRNADFEKGIITYEKQVDAYWDPEIKRAHEGHKSLVAKKAAFVVPAQEAKRISKAYRAAWEEEEAKARRADELRLQEIARKAEEDRRLAEAQAAEADGDKAMAEAIISEPLRVAPVVLEHQVPNVGAGSALRTVWRARIKDPNAVPREFCIPDQTSLNAYARATKGTARVAGVEFYSERV